jgi:hypothetical protein
MELPTWNLYLYWQLQASISSGSLLHDERNNIFEFCTEQTGKMTKRTSQGEDRTQTVTDVGTQKIWYIYVSVTTTPNYCGRDWEKS